jgi:hypothetical protein
MGFASPREKRRGPPSYPGASLMLAYRHPPRACSLPLTSPRVSSHLSSYSQLHPERSRGEPPRAYAHQGPPLKTSPWPTSVPHNGCEIDMLGTCQPRVRQFQHCTGSALARPSYWRNATFFVRKQRREGAERIIFVGHDYIMEEMTSQEKPLQKYHIPSDLVVAQWVSNVESSSPRDFLLLHDLWTTFRHLLWSQIISAISTACDFTTKSGGIWKFMVRLWHHIAASLFLPLV